ncbi:sensor histidine kinase [Rhodanobacter caeni]|uniref:histidine kinase n=1 Tax=Rhodanobacter caeni TaxID=657654 RepID=A0ABN0U6N8_9GAMM
MSADGANKAFVFRPITMLVAVGLLLVAGALAAAYQYRTARIERRHQLVTQANILAASVTAAIAFNDRAAAQEYVNALMLDPRLDAVAVYNEFHGRVAGFQRAGSAPITDSLRDHERLPSDRRLVEVPARQGAMTVGRVYLRAAETPLLMQLARYSGVALLTIMAVLMLSALAMAQSVLSRAHAALRKRAIELAEANERLGAEMEQRARTEEALRQSQKMEAIGQLSGGIAHDFNNLLMIIKASLTQLQAKLLQDDPTSTGAASAAHERVTAVARPHPAGEPPALLRDAAAIERREAQQRRIKRYLDVAQDGVERAASLTQRLLSFARQQPLSPKTLRLDHLIRGMSALLEHSVGANVKIDYQLHSRGFVRCDANQMENAILNLVGNARDAMPDGGRIVIQLDDVRIDAANPMDDLPHGAYTRLQVVDNGVGMSEKVRQKAFEPFFTTKPVGKGTGLGLSTIFGYVVQSRGVASIDSEIGRGTTITIVLPHVPDDDPSEKA